MFFKNHLRSRFSNPNNFVFCWLKIQQIFRSLTLKKCPCGWSRRLISNSIADESSLNYFQQFVEEKKKEIFKRDASIFKMINCDFNETISTIERVSSKIIEPSKPLSHLMVFFGFLQLVYHSVVTWQNLQTSSRNSLLCLPQPSSHRHSELSFFFD